MFQLCGLAILGVGVLMRSKTSSFDEIVHNVTLSSTTLIVIGAIIFIIAFFGCCGAIRESHCMTITVSVFQYKLFSRIHYRRFVENFLVRLFPFGNTISTSSISSMDFRVFQRCRQYEDRRRIFQNF